ncbi:lactonase family protein [Streptomyces sp. NPDC059762]|uniref:lactonase family protein n=1 Tax=Streptomyces sp. NPDC059762 TaxID=3346938 RepID=UPI003650B6DA
MGGTETHERATGRARAYLGSFPSAGGLGVLAADVDPATGALTLTGATDAVADPSYLALADGVLYAVSETEPGAVAALAPDGAAPRPLGDPVPVGGAGPTHLAVAAGHLLTANYTSGSVSVLPLGADGVPGTVTAVLRHEGGGPVADRQSAPHAHQVQPDPSGRWTVSVDLGTDSVRVCALDPATGALRLHRETALRPGYGPRHLAFHPAGGHAYVVGELEPAVTVCRWDDRRGELTPLAEIPLVDADTAGPAYPSAVVVAPDGRFLWVAVRGTDTIAVLVLSPAGDEAIRSATHGHPPPPPRPHTPAPPGRGG